MSKKKKSILPFARILAEKLEEKNLTLKEAAELSGTNKSVIHGWMCGSYPQDLNAVAKLSAVLDMQMYKLLFGKDDPHGNVVGMGEFQKVKHVATEQELIDLANEVIDLVLKKYRSK